MADELRVGIIGANPTAGWAARAHLPAFAAGVPSAELVAVSTTRQESADEAAKQFGAAHAFDDHRKLLALPDVDAVAVVVKLPMHYELAKDAIEAGKHTYVEWPLGTTTAQAEELTDLAKQKGVRTAVGLQARRSAEYLHMGKLINDGYLGNVLSCTLSQITSGALGRPAARMWMRDKTAQANTLTIGFAHVLDGLMTALGRLNSVSARVNTQVREWTATDTGEKLPVDSPDDVLVSGELARGGSVAMHVAGVARQSTGHRFEVHGTEGTLAIQSASSPHGSPAKLLGAQGTDPELNELEVPDRPWVLEAGLKGSAINIGKLWESFARSILDGSSEFDPDFGSALQHHQLIDAVQRASDTGQAQAV